MLGPKPSDEWFVSEQGVLSGPFPKDRIIDRVRWGKISSDALLCDAYGSAWFPITCSPFASAFPDGARKSPAPILTGARVAPLLAVGLALAVIVASFTA